MSEQNGQPRKPIKQTLEVELEVPGRLGQEALKRIGFAIMSIMYLVPGVRKVTVGVQGETKEVSPIIKPDTGRPF